jgi:hypothetical protein
VDFKLSYFAVGARNASEVRNERETESLLLLRSRQPSGIQRPDDGGSKHIQSVGLLQRDCTALYPIKAVNVHTAVRTCSLTFLSYVL